MHVSKKEYLQILFNLIYSKNINIKLLKIFSMDFIITLLQFMDNYPFTLPEPQFNFAFSNGMVVNIID